MGGRILVRGVVAVAVGLAALAGRSAAADAPTKKLEVTIQRKVDYSAAKGTLKVTVSGKAVGLEPGMKIAVQLAYHFSDPLAEAIATITADGTFGDTVLEAKMKLPPDEGYEITWDLRVDDQAPRLKDPVKKLVASAQRESLLASFAIGSDAERKKARDGLVAFIKETLEKAVALNNELVAEFEAAEKKTKYQKDTAFDPAAWRAFMDKTWRPKIIALQKAFADWKQKNPAYEIKYRSGVLHLDDLLRTVAFRGIDRSKQVYLLAKLKIVTEDALIPPELNASPQIVSVRTDKKAKSHLGVCYKAAKEGFNLEPPPPPPPPPKTEKGAKEETGKKEETPRKEEPEKKGKG